MRLNQVRSRLCAHLQARFESRLGSWRWGRTLACLGVIAVLAGAAEPGRQAASADPGHQAGGSAPNSPNEGLREKESLETAKPGGRQIAADSAELLRLATELKAEVDKTNTDTLSIPVVRKAGEIEKLARSVKQKGRAGVGGN
jgi:hypothetical protein